MAGNGRAAMAAALLLASVAIASVAPPRVSLAAEPSRPVAADPRLRRAESMLRQGRAQQAYELYSLLERDYPGDVTLKVGLASSALGAGKLEHARRVIAPAIEADPSSPDWIRLHGRLLAAEGKEQDALAAWRQLLSVIPDRESAYRITANMIAAEKMLPEAIALYHEGRDALGDSLLWGVEMAELYDITGRGDLAAMEYARAVAAGRLSASDAAARSLELGLQSADVRTVDAMVRGLSFKDPNRRAEMLDFLSHLWLSAGECSEARLAAGEADRSAANCGDRRLRLAYRMTDGACEADALEMLRAVVASCSSSSAGWRARQMLAARLTDDGQFREARRILEELVGAAPEGTPEHAQGLLDLGALLLDGARDPGAARDTYGRFTARYPSGEAGWTARLGAARASLLLGDFEVADAACRARVEQGGNGLTREAALFGLAELTFFSGEFEESKATIEQLIEQYPKGVYLNDAVERLLFIEEGAGTGDELMQEFAGALRAGLAGDAAGASERLRVIFEEFPFSTLRDDAVMEIAFLAEWMEDFEASLAGFAQLVETFPESRLAPRALLEKGRIRWVHLGDYNGAKAEWERLLADYPESLLIDEARAMMVDMEARQGRGTNG